jgi:acetyl-CoA carboxylase biotin carboxyl carrier protein
MYTLEELKEIIQLTTQAELGELLIENESFKLRIRGKNYTKSKGISYTNIPAATNGGEPPKIQIETPKIEPISTKVESVKPSIEGTKICAPMIGTFYRSASPELPPFVKVGDTVKKGDVLGIIEAMKLFNEITSEFDGVITKVFIDNASAVEYDQALFLIEKR